MGGESIILNAGPKPSVPVHCRLGGGGSLLCVRGALYQFCRCQVYVRFGQRMLVRIGTYSRIRKTGPKWQKAKIMCKTETSRVELEARLPIPGLKQWSSQSGSGNLAATSGPCPTLRQSQRPQRGCVLIGQSWTVGVGLQPNSLDPECRELASKARASGRNRIHSQGRVHETAQPCFMGFTCITHESLAGPPYVSVSPPHTINHSRSNRLHPHTAKVRWALGDQLTCSLGGPHMLTICYLPCAVFWRQPKTVFQVSQRSRF